MARFKSLALAFAISSLEIRESWKKTEKLYPYELFPGRIDPPFGKETIMLSETNPKAGYMIREWLKGRMGGFGS